MEDENKVEEVEEIEEKEEVSTEAFAELISDKDKRIDELENEIKKLQKTNAQMLVRMNAASKETEVNFEETVIDFCDTRKVSRK